MNDNIYDRLGVPRVINGMSWVTTLGGSIMPPEVVQAMVQAVPHYVDMEVLNRKAGEIIARITGAEAGMVTAGAAAGQVAMVAACIAGKDATIVERLPDTTGLRNEIVILRCHRNHYDRCFLIPGARFVEIGKATTAYEWELEAAIDDNTAAVAYVLGPFRKYPLSLEQVVKIAHDRDVPVIVDAAAMVPPAMNLKKYVALGADMVVFSGGKGIRGPQSTGILCGRKGLVEAAAVNFLNFPGRYYAGVGRPMKVSKEQIVALITALELFERTDHDAEWAVWRSQSQVIVCRSSAIMGHKRGH